MRGKGQRGRREREEAGGGKEGRKRTERGRDRQGGGEEEG